MAYRAIRIFSARSVLLAVCLGFAASSAQATSIAITEFINNVTGNESTDEWVELFNFGAAPVTLNGWDIADEDVDVDTIPTVTLGPGDFAIIAKNKSAFETQWLGGTTDSRVVEVPGLTLANGGDEIILSDNTSTPIWSLAYPNGEDTGRATFLSIDHDEFNTTTFGSKASPGVDFDGLDIDATTGFLGYESNADTTDFFAFTSSTGDIGSPLAGNYVSQADRPTTGDITFAGYNADGNDNLAIVILKDLKAGTVVRFSENEWQGAAFNTGEEEFAWVLTEDVPAGTVVKFDNLDGSPTPSVSTGELVFDGSFAALLNVTSEAVYAFIGPDGVTPSTFLGAIANNDDLYDGTDGTLFGTNLILNLTAVLLPNSTDVAEYAALNRSTPHTPQEWLALIGDVPANWVTQSGSGDQSNDGTPPDIPFNMTPFNVSVVPEPTTLALISLGLAGLGFTRRRRGRLRA